MNTIMLKLAWRNLWRNRTRTLIVASAITLSYSLMLLFFGVSDDSYQQIMDSAAEAAGGDILIQGDGYWETQSSDIVVDDPDRVVEAVASVEGVEHVIPRVLSSGLMTSPTGNEPVMLQGIDPQKQFAINDLSEDVVLGEFFSGEYDHPIVIDQDLHEKLNVELGDKLVLTATTPDGEMTRALFRLDGVVEIPGAAQAGGIAFTTIPAAQDALRMGDRIVQVGAYTSDAADHVAVHRAIEDALADEPIEVLTWEEANPGMVGFIEMDSSFGSLFIFLIIVIVTFAIANTFLMAVMERVREFGLLNAIGLTPGRIGALIMWETAVLAVVSLAVGFAIGFSAHLWISSVGIDMSSMYEGVDITGVDVSEMVIYSYLNPLKWALGTLGVFLIVILSAAYPAWKASQMGPAEAMRFYE
jgi:ABC-type lipoprotein release transport system permease subunit